MVMARALAEHKGLLKINVDAPPVWARGGPENPYIFADDAPAAESETPKKRRRIPKKLF
jgi:hypothetical protein